MRIDTHAFSMRVHVQLELTHLVSLHSISLQVSMTGGSFVSFEVE